MTKIKITFTVEFEPCLEDYGDDHTIESALEVDLSNATDDPSGFLQLFEGDLIGSGIKITGEIINE